jgi:hypothetical protein
MQVRRHSTVSSSTRAESGLANENAFDSIMHKAKNVVVHNIGSNFKK